MNSSQSSKSLSLKSLYLFSKNKRKKLNSNGIQGQEKIRREEANLEEPLESPLLPSSTSTPCLLSPLPYVSPLTINLSPPIITRSSRATMTAQSQPRSRRYVCAHRAHPGRRRCGMHAQTLTHTCFLFTLKYKLLKTEIVNKNDLTFL